jgi:hypothetical protein
MSAVLEPLDWSPRRWWMTVAMVFVAQIAAVYWLSDRSAGWKAPSTRTMPIYLLEYQEAAMLPELLFSTDPTAFVLANHRGFSGGAWLNVAPQNYALADWSEPPRWLALPQEQLGQSLVRYFSTNPPPVFQLAEKLPVRPGLLESVAQGTIRTQSFLRVQPPLQLRTAPPELPVWTHEDVLNPTVVEVGIDLAGEVRSARLLPVPRAHAQAGHASQRSGLPAADRAALAAARLLQFEPVPSAGASIDPNGVWWGQVVFHWHATSAPSADRGAARPEVAPPPR